MLVEERIETYTPKINKDFAWFTQNLGKSLIQSFADFWECEYKLKLVGLCQDTFDFFKTEEFFVTKIALKKNLTVDIRVSKTLLANLFFCMGNPPETFDITKITELEAKILNTFNEYVYNNFKDKLTILDKKYSKVQVCENLVFGVMRNDEEIGKYIVTIPKEVLEIDVAQTENVNFKIDDFLNTAVGVDIIVGTSMISLNDLKSLSAEDIIILDNSNLNTMKVRINNREISFKVAPDPALIMNLEDNGDNEIMENSNISQDMWDNIQVEIGAEFDKVKISLGELKQISEGLVLDIASVYDNKIFLKVENKKIAQGELVIINDKYGVRIDKLCADEPAEQVVSQAQAQAKPSPQEQPQASDIPSDDGESDDFDYSDFEIEDENI